MILGLYFMRKYYTVFDFEKLCIGFDHYDEFNLPLINYDL